MGTKYPTYVWLKIYRSLLLLTALLVALYIDGASEYLVSITIVCFLAYVLLEQLKSYETRCCYNFEQFISITVDIVLISAIIKNTGGHWSPFRSLYVIQFIQMGYFYGFKETFLAGLLSAVGFYFVFYFQNPSPVVIIHGAINFITALVVGFLARKRSLILSKVKLHSREHEKLQEKSVVLDSLTELASAMAEFEDIQQIVNFLDSYVRNITFAERAVFVLPGETSPVIYLKNFKKGTDYHVLQGKEYAWDSLRDAELLLSNVPQNIYDTEHNPVFRQWLKRVGSIPELYYFARDFKSVMALPIRHGEEIFGHLMIANCNHIRAFDAEQLEMAKILTNALAVYLKKIDSVNKLKQKYDEVVRMAAKMVDLKDAYTLNHSRRVAMFARDIGEAMGFDGERLKKLVIAGLLHDVGKVGIPDAMLKKPGKLTNQEFMEIKRHPVKGAELLRTVSGMEDVAVWVSQHHERLDGKGYPEGLQGDEISLEGRIIAVADAFEAMTSDRAYRSKLPTAVALGELEKHAGTQFDAEVVRVFKKIIEEQYSAEGLAQAGAAPDVG